MSAPTVPVRTFRYRRSILLLIACSVAAVGGFGAWNYQSDAPIATNVPEPHRAASIPPDTNAPAAASSTTAATAPANDGETLAIATNSIVEPTPTLQAETIDVSGEPIAVNLAILEQGRAKLEKIPGYTATFFKQERISGHMTEPQSILLKVRHEPFSVYMKWLEFDKGKELLYVDGQLEGNMLVKLGGWKGRMVPALKIEPKGERAQSQARYPVTEAGLLALIDILIHNRRHDLEHKVQVKCDFEDGWEWEGVPCYKFDLLFAKQNESETYRRSIQYIDKQTLLPVWIKNYTWPESDAQLSPEQLDDATLIEHYTYTSIDLAAELGDADFDRAHEDYHFNRK